MAKELDHDVDSCLAFRTKGKINLVSFNKSSQVEGVFSGQPLQERAFLRIGPQLFAQFYNDKPILRELLNLGEIPLHCLQAITAIEDDRFLDHRGVNPTSILRATLKNIVNMGVVEGGSTITQQLVKNYFLTSKRTFQRKLKEIFMAMLLELRLDKDEIFQHYLNVIYMGQNGPFEVRGYGSASQHYFGKAIESLDLPQCALMAAIVNSPGRFNPFKYPKRAKRRRDRALLKMKEYDMIGESERERASVTPLPQRVPRNLSEPAPYYLQVVHREMKELNIDISQGLRVYTNLEIYAQETAHQSIRSQMAWLEKNLEKEKNSGEDRKLQALLISISLDNGGIVALEGGRDYKQTQYNRALNAHRQVGSVMKPFVYLAALESVNEEGEPYTPLTLLEDLPFTHEYEGQTWTPGNYEEDFKGQVPMFYALKNSINVPTAKLGLQVGLSSILDVSRRLGIYSHIVPLPSLTLGAFELYPLEVAESFATIARFGEYLPVSTIVKIESFDGNLIYERELKSETRVSPDTAAVLVGMLKQTLITGTARSISSWRGFTRSAAGKTGTTSDTRDAWFVGFTPYVLTVVWVGYDDNSSTGLTGSSGAVPIWSHFMKRYGETFPADDFKWPENTTAYEYKWSEMQDVVPGIKEHEKIPHRLIFRRGNEP